MPPAHIRRIARLLPGKRVLVTVAHSLQRAEHGEQPVWMGAVLAAASYLQIPDLVALCKKRLKRHGKYCHLRGGGGGTPGGPRG